MGKKKKKNTKKTPDDWGPDTDESLEFEAFVDALSWVERYGGYQNAVAVFRRLLDSLDELHAKLRT